MYNNSIANNPVLLERSFLLYRS